MMVGWLSDDYEIRERPDFALLGKTRTKLWKRKVFDQRAMMVAFGMIGVERLSAGAQCRLGADLVGMILRSYYESMDKRFVSRHMLDGWICAP